MIQELCPACGAALDCVHVHSHRQCARCKTVIESCCEGEAGRETQLDEARLPDDGDTIIVKVAVSRSLLESAAHYEYAQQLGEDVIDVATSLLIQTVDGSVEED
jgi:hypothetical protein